MSLITTVIRVCCFLALTPAITAAGVHKCLDGGGKTVYQDKPCLDLTATQMSPALSRLSSDKNTEHPVWKGVLENRTIYVMAGLSYGSTDWYPLPEPVMDAFSAASALLIAADLETADPEDVNKAVAGKDTFSDGSGLKNHVKPGTWERALNLASGLDIGEDVLNTKKPWAAALMLRAASAKKAGYDGTLGTSKSLIKAAGISKTVVELDPLADQIAVADDLAEDEQEQVLLQVLNEMEQREEYFKSMVDAWKNGDKASLDLLVRRSFDTLPSSKMLYERLAGSRNEGLASKIDELATDGKTYFIVAEATRLVGEKGLLGLLQTKGFKLSQL